MLGLVTRGNTAEPTPEPQLWHSGHDTWESIGARDSSLTRTRGLSVDGGHPTGRGVKSALEKLRRLGLLGAESRYYLAIRSPGWPQLAFHGGSAALCS